MRGIRPSSLRAAGGFTLVELLLAVTLLVMIILVSSFIFDTTTKAVSLAQAANEMNARLEAFSQLLRHDVKSVEHQGYLVLGARRLEAYGSPKNRTNEMKQTFRTDWMMFLSNCEQDAAVDARSIGHWARIFYGHGKVSDPTGSSFEDHTRYYYFKRDYYDDSGYTRYGRYSNVATDWALMRHQLVLLSKTMVSSANYEGVEIAGSATQYGTGAQHQRAMLSYAVRDFRWCTWYNGQWQGSVSVNYGASGSTYSGRLAIDEPTYYHTMHVRTSDPRKFHVLEHCANFEVRYAMPEDLTAGPGGTIRWRNPPYADQFNYLDPNYRADVNDPLHPAPTIPIFYLCPHCGRVVPENPRDVTTNTLDCTISYCQQRMATPQANEATKMQYNVVRTTGGRLVFGPGDRWPALLKISVWVFDPLDRLDGGKKLRAVIPVP